jgi:hypothetical protein
MNIGTPSHFRISYTQKYGLMELRHFKMTINSVLDRSWKSRSSTVGCDPAPGARGNGQGLKPARVRLSMKELESYKSAGRAGGLQSFLYYVVQE